MTILVVDDDTWQADHYRRELERAGYKVKLARHAYEAISEIDNEQPILLLLDLMLPGSNGITLLHELRSYPDLAAIPVIVVSSAPVALEVLKPYGVTEVLDKTKSTNEELLATVRKVLG